MSDTDHDTTASDLDHKPHGQDIRFGFVFLLLSVSAIVIFCIIMGTQAWFHHEQRLELEGKSMQQANWALADLHAVQVHKITSWRWIDAKSGVAAVPIERAMELTAQRYAQEKSGK